VGWGSMDSDSAKIGSGEIEMNDGSTSIEQRNIDMLVTPPHSSKEDSEFPFTGEFAKHDEQVKEEGQVSKNSLLPDVLRPRGTLELTWQDMLLPSVSIKSLQQSPSVTRSTTIPNLSDIESRDGFGDRQPRSRSDLQRSGLRIPSDHALGVAGYGAGFIPLQGPRIRITSWIKRYSSYNDTA
jgi:hypothetical protein